MVFKKGNIAQNAIPVTIKRLRKKFWASIEQAPGPDGCWNWTARLAPNGYGHLVVGKYRGPNYFLQGAHRFSWELFNGEIPAGLNICHRCDNRRCVNPRHLFAATQMENIRDKIQKGRDSRGEKHSVATKLKTPRGSANPSAKLSEENVREILERIKRGERRQEIADRFGVVKGTVARILEGKNWKHITGLGAA